MNRKYEFKKKLEELGKKSGRGTELITVYIPPDKQISDVTSQLRDEHGQASNIKSKSTRTNVQSALESILSRLKYIRKPPPHGMVIFCGAIDVGGDKTEMETTVLEPLEPVVSYKYHCNSTFLLDPLKEMIEDKKTFGLLVLDRREATIGLLVGKRIEPMKHLTSSVPGKQRKGGQSARRFERLREIAIDDFYKRIAIHADEIFLRVNRKDLQGILIGGPSPTKEEFIRGKYLHYELQQKMLGGFDVAYTDESGLSELMDAACERLAELDLMHEKMLMGRFMHELINETVAYGENSVREKILEGAVDVLLISEDVQLGIVSDLSEMAEERGANVEFISTDFEEGSQLSKAFGGIAAILRY